MGPSSEAHRRRSSDPSLFFILAKSSRIRSCRSGLQAPRSDHLWRHCAYASAIPALASSKVSAIPRFGGGAPITCRNQHHLSPAGICSKYMRPITVSSSSTAKSSCCQGRGCRPSWRSWAFWRRRRRVTGVFCLLLIRIKKRECGVAIKGGQNEREAARCPQRLQWPYGPIPYRAWIEARLGRWPLGHRPLARRRWVLVAVGSGR
jgi:hypothetical protein